jgi:hypothetical protein
MGCGRDRGGEGCLRVCTCLAKPQPGGCVSNLPGAPGVAIKRTIVQVVLDSEAKVESLA